MADGLRWAVTDGPDGTSAVELPADAVAARRLAEQARGGLWCARAAGGCGGRLAVVDGDPPGLGHTGDDPCAFRRRPAAAGHAYDHLRYRPALLSWLTGQGHRPRVLRVPDAAGHPGLRLVVESLGAVLEVRLAPLSDTAWRARDDRARGAARSVTWLYGPDADAAAATEASVRGAALSLRRHDRGLLVGVRDAGGAVRWVRLAACSLTADGVTAPGLEDARAAHARRTAERQEAARRAARRPARRPARTRPGAAEELPLWPLASTA
ncbi:hypothetical protein LY71_10422 [Geodermatophilus tzadiensis]|uniref:Competence protein CoiA-like protein n=1 Tax=Geodermatophilus tzadiensis TaxID=1137988 RepID=A0A2T0TWA3_9ACTN|nr:hypothetical protein [Geodermatophilus tzadiensis]PRY49986.1 hypothetical protein LY71_10422 [Geodermatophilus tzadiensis]